MASSASEFWDTFHKRCEALTESYTATRRHAAEVEVCFYGKPRSIEDALASATGSTYRLMAQYWYPEYSLSRGVNAPRTAALRQVSGNLLMRMSTTVLPPLVQAALAKYSRAHHDVIAFISQYCDSPAAK